METARSAPWAFTWLKGSARHVWKCIARDVRAGKIAQNVCQGFLKMIQYPIAIVQDASSLVRIAISQILKITTAASAFLVFTLKMVLAKSATFLDVSYVRGQKPAYNVP